MAITRQELQVKWTGDADSDSIGAGSSEESLEFNLDATCVRAQITLKADSSSSLFKGVIVSRSIISYVFYLSL